MFWRLRQVTVAVMGMACIVAAQSSTGELYRPDYHLASPGDPSGCLRFQGIYHIFTWDHFISSDLVHWTPVGWPMQGDTGDVGYWTGSVVVDKDATTGWGSTGTPAMVAVYTAHDVNDSKEDIRLSVCTDGNYQEFYYYAYNPVLTTPDTLFRDPHVFWHAPTARWIMVVARSEARSVQFYRSTDLKTWTFMSEFGPVGGRDQIWEVPGLVQMPVKGLDERKWVLFCGMGPNREQFFVGDFDGTNFTMDATCQGQVLAGVGLPGEVFADFEEADYAAAGWTIGGADGDAFGSAPGSGDGSQDQPVIGFLGRQLATSYPFYLADYRDDSWLLSPPFTISKNCINFLIAGGSHPGQTCINLVVEGVVRRTATGDDSNIMKWMGWDVREFIGDNAEIQIVDDYAGNWGRIYVDHIMFSDVLMNTGCEHANWIDWGSDFYGARVYSDYDDAENTLSWMGWMGNWTYATNVPSPWHGGGPQTIPRNVQLEPVAGGYRIAQQPLAALQSLRGPEIMLPPRRVEGTMFLDGFYPSTNAYEIEAVFNLHAPDLHVGFNFCAGSATGQFDKVTLGYDAALSDLYLDRRYSGDVSFHPDFANVTHAPLLAPEGEIKFHVFIDHCSIEAFVNDGKRVMTSIFFPHPDNRAVEVFSVNGPATLRSLKAWELSGM